MPVIDNIPTTWSSAVTLAAEEWWQCKSGVVALTLEETPGDKDGLELRVGEGVQIASGKAVRYRAVSGVATIAREAF